ADKDYTGKDILALDRSEAMLDLLLTARRGKGAERLTEKNGRQYRIEANPVFSRGLFSGVALLIMDVTEREQAERLRREFTANVSHELKTPLHTISGCAELLSNGMVKPGDEKGFSNQIYTEAQRMIHLVDDIIGLSRLDEGAEDMQREEVDLYALAQEVAGRFAPTAEEAKVSLSVQGGQATVVGIRRMLDTLISNLCSNAIKYNRPGGRVDITVEAAQREVKLTVADNGIGIPAEHQSRVFERFYRVDKSRSKAVGGTGLGLSIVKHAALVHHAKIQMESQPEKGTAITVIFPR
ncbi:MAG: PAS domain-containing sensor histidine kinase, partial [Oscillospiraceae bacterium]|nr:PAS domain-containing sensor histidine kinase [Oscillospiraceae bacterium]